MDPMINFCGKLDTLANVYKGLNGDIIQIIDKAIEDNTDGSYLLQFLKRANDVDLPHPVLELLLKNYDHEYNVFSINSQRLTVTLQDVMYITGLPIDGEVVTTSNSRNTDAIKDTLGVDLGKISMTKLQTIAMDGVKTIDQRMTALFLLIIACIIIPSPDLKMIASSYIEFVRDRSRINSYAWGAALLAYLNAGLMKGMKDETNKIVKGNLWVVLCFFLVRIPKLAPAMLVKVEDSDMYHTIQVKFDDVRKNAPMFYNIIDEVLPISHDHHYPCLSRVKVVIDNLSSSDVNWSPYEQTLLPSGLIQQQQRVTYLGPILCLNHMTYHRPIDVPGQFAEEFSGLDVQKVYKNVQKKMYPARLKSKENKGPKNQNFKRFFRKQIELWVAGKTVEGYHIDIEAKKKRPNTDADGDGDGGHVHGDVHEDGDGHGDGGHGGDGGRDGDGDHDGVYQHVHEEDTILGSPEIAPIVQQNDETVAANEDADNRSISDGDHQSTFDVALDPIITEGIYQQNDGVFDGNFNEDVRVTSPHPSSPPKNDDNVKKKNKRKDACLEGGQVASNLPNKRPIKKRKELNVDITGVRDQGTPSSVFSPSGRKPPLKGKRTKAKKRES